MNKIRQWARMTAERDLFSSWWIRQLDREHRQAWPGFDHWGKTWWLYRCMMSALGDRRAHGIVLNPEGDLTNILAIALIQQPAAGPLHVFTLIGNTPELATELRNAITSTSPRHAQRAHQMSTSSAEAHAQFGWKYIPFALYDAPFRCGMAEVTNRDYRARMRTHLRMAGLLPEVERLVHDRPDAFAGSQDRRSARRKPTNLQPPPAPLGTEETGTLPPRPKGVRAEEWVAMNRQPLSGRKDLIDPGFIGDAIDLDIDGP
jgi:hypothetical protein